MKIKINSITQTHTSYSHLTYSRLSAFAFARDFPPSLSLRSFTLVWKYS